MIRWTYANWMKDDKMSLLKTDGSLKIEMKKKKKKLENLLKYVKSKNVLHIS